MNDARSTAPARRRLPRIAQPIWFFWFVLCVITILNFNGISTLAGTRERFFSPVMLMCATVVIVGLLPELKKITVSPMPWVLVFCVVYIVVGLFSATTSHYGYIGVAILRVPQYVAALLIVLAGVVLATRASAVGRIDTVLKVLFWLVVAASLSGVLIFLFPGPLGFLAAAPGQRITGVFGNPNELGLQSGYAIAFGIGLTLRTRNPLWVILGVIAGIVGTVSSFSKTAMLGMLPLLALVAYALGGARFRARPIALLVVGLIGLVVGGQKLAFRALEESTGLQLDNEQRRRLLAISDVLESRELSSTATTGRTEIWKAGIKDWSASPVIGLGLTSFDNVHVIDMEIHNTFLRVLGESGILGMIPFLIMLMAFGRAVVRCEDTGIHIIGLGFILVQLPLMMSTGGALLFRNHNMMTGSVLGIVMGCLIMERRERMARRRLKLMASAQAAAPTPVETS